MDMTKEEKRRRKTEIEKLANFSVNIYGKFKG
jgi:hypothetical protein